MDVAYNYNYMAFKNTSFENKWFYAFVTNVEYVNNITVEITYEIDYIQTWISTVDFNQCFIERQHQETDNYGDNLQPETPATGPFVYDELEEINYTPAVVLVTTIDKDHLIIDVPITEIPGYQNLARSGMISGCWYYIYDCTDTADMTLLQVVLKAIEVANKQDEVLCLIMAALELWDNSGTYSPTYKYYSAPTAVGSYTPRNSKVLVYPYSALSITTWDGNETLFQQELFDNTLVGRAMFEGWQNINAMSSLLFIPHHYKNRVINYDEAVESPTTPQCSWKNDQYMAWLSQNFMGSIVNPLKSIEPTYEPAPATTEGIIPANSEALTTVGEPVISGATIGAAAALTLVDACVVKPLTIPDKFRGHLSNTARYQLRGLGFNVMRRRITEEYAKRLDKYFDMFGYKMNKVAVPNLHARPKYTYIKTIKCSVHGYLPSDAARKIEQIFDGGIRFWDTSATFGSFDHSVNDNRPISNAPVTPSQNNTENGGEPNE